MTRRRRQLAVILILALAVSAGIRYALPGLVRRAAISRIEAVTHRHVRMDRVDLSLLAGRLTVHGFQLGDRTAGMDLTHFERLDVRIRPIALLRGHLWIRELVLRGSTVRVVRFADGFNISDLIEGPSTTALNLDVTIDSFRLIGGTVMFEDRALREPRTWTSENIQIEARNVSTRHDAGTAEASSVTAGAPVSIKLEHFRLVPIHLEAAVEVKGLDVSLARLYFPPDAPVVVDRGRASTSLRVTFDAHAGLRATATNQIEDVALVKPSTGERLLLIPTMASRLSDFVFRDGRVEVGRFELTGSASVLDPSAPGGPRFQTSTVRASIAGLTWPVTAPGRLEVEASVPGGGRLALAGSVRPPPASSQLRLRLARVNLAPWARLLPVSAQISGLAESDLSIDEPLAVGVPANVRGSIAVTALAATDLGREVLRVRRVEADGLQVHWPASLAVRRLSIASPRGLLERDKTGELLLQHLVNASRSPVPEVPIGPSGRARPSTAGSPSLTIGEIVVVDGTLAWRDGAVTPTAALDFSRIEASAKGVGWPLRGPIDVRGAVKLPGSGQVDVQGRVSVNDDPSAARLRVTAREADVSPYTPYLRTPAHIKGWADLDVTVDLPRSPEGRATVRGTVALSRVDVRDEQRTVLRLERGVATDVEAVWPERIAIREVAFRRPWVLIERDQDGALTLLSLLPSAPAGQSAQDGPRRSVALALRQLAIEQGGVRVVDRSLSPPFALDVSRLAASAEGLATAPAKPARVSITGRIADSLLDVSGTIGPLGAPVRLDVQGGLKGLWVPRTDPYLLRYVGWEARAGWLTTSIRCRIDRDALDASTDIRLSRLAVAEGSRDQAQSRIGLPLGLIVALMKDSNGDIHVSLPVRGRLLDPRFDFSEAIWSTVRNAAIKAITLPVSWIGRVRLSSDARIERVEIDPVRFQPGTATFTTEGDAQAGQLIRFLHQAPEARVLLTPMVSAEDLTAVRRRALDSELERVAGGGQVSKDAAALRLFERRFPHLPAPSTPDAIVAALIANQPLPDTVATELATQRVEAVRTAAKKASVDPGRLPDRKLVPESEAVESQVALDLAEPERPERPGRRLPEFLRKLGAAASTSGRASD